MPKCTQTERELLDALFEANKDHANCLVVKSGKEYDWFDCPICSYEGLGPRTARLEAAILAADTERLGKPRPVHNVKT